MAVRSDCGYHGLEIPIDATNRRGDARVGLEDGAGTFRQAHVVRSSHASVSCGRMCYWRQHRLWLRSHYRYQLGIVVNTVVDIGIGIGIVAVFGIGIGIGIGIGMVVGICIGSGIDISIGVGIAIGTVIGIGIA